MSINMSGDITDFDAGEYSDYETQMIKTESSFGNPTDNNPSVNVRFQVDPLEGRGGLDTNEVAELVHIQLQAAVEFEDEFADQNVSSAAEGRGVLGANLAAKNSEYLNNSPITGSGETFSSRGVNSNATQEYRVKSDNSYFLTWMTYAGLPFDSGSGPGGNADRDAVLINRHMREIYGRGPVMDNNDDLSFVQALNVGDTLIPCSHVVRAHLTWDTAEVDEAGRQFAVPTDD